MTHIKSFAFALSAIALTVSAFEAKPALAATEPSVVRYALTSEPPQLDQTKATDVQSFFVLGHVMEGLTRYGKSSGDALPGVAEKWTINDKEATFHLRKNAKWMDGKPVTAKDFVYGWRTVVDPKTASQYAFIMYPVKNAEAINQGKMPVTALGVQATDDYTLKVTFEKPCGYFLGLTSFATFDPLREDFHSKNRERYAADAADIMTNGPYKLTKWVHGASLTMEKNENYWNKDSIAIDRIEIPYITPDNSARFNFFKDHKTDILESMNKDDLQKASSEKFKMRNFSDGTLLFLEFNFRQGRATANKNLRKAIAAAFNPEEFVTRVVGIPGTKAAKGLIPEWLKGTKEGFRKEYPLAAPKQDLAAAKKYLEAAKAEMGGKIPPLVWLTGDTPLAGREAEYFQQVLKSNLGIDLKIDKQIFKQRLAKMSSGDFDIASGGWGPDFADPMTFAELWTTWNENNRGLYKNAEYDKLIRKAQSTSNPKVRMDAMAAAEKLAMEDLPILPTTERTVVYLVHDNVQGIVRHAIGPDPDFTFAKVVKQ